ncbi:MAG: 50S ribosomal protein L4 [Candidatus Midichloria sp.]|nr:50S ribosomal protein L4 [Candidatus Midichloria sp.]
MKVDLLDLENQKKGEIELSSLIFGQIVRADIMHRVVVWQMAKRRAGTHSSKEVAEVEGSTRKIYKQKGTGRARHGSIRAPQFRGGAVIFGPHPRSHEFSLNKKIRKLGLISALSLKKQENSIIVLDELKVQGYKAGLMLKKLKGLNATASLLVDGSVDSAVLGSISNLPYVDALPVVGLNVLDILKHNKLILTVDALKKIEERLL